jgi:hypothetical protein
MHHKQMLVIRVKATSFAFKASVSTVKGEKGNAIPVTGHDGR